MRSPTWSCSSNSHRRHTTTCLGKAPGHNNTTPPIVLCVMYILLFSNIFSICLSTMLSHHYSSISLVTMWPSSLSESVSLYVIPSRIHKMSLYLIHLLYLLYHGASITINVLSFIYGHWRIHAYLSLVPLSKSLLDLTIVSDTHACTKLHISKYSRFSLKFKYKAIVCAVVWASDPYITPIKYTKGVKIWVCSRQHCSYFYFFSFSTFAIF